MLDRAGLVIPMLSLAGLLAWLVVAGRLRHSAQDTRIAGTVIVIAALLLASSAFYVFAPSSSPLLPSDALLFVNLARLVVLGAALWILWRPPDR